MESQFDVFLSYNSEDRDLARKLKDELHHLDVHAWLDADELPPGRPWLTELEKATERARSAAVLVGKAGLGPWQSVEMRSCLAEFVNRGMPVIPVLLPGASDTPNLPAFLRQFMWIDLRPGMTDELMQKLASGVRSTELRNNSRTEPCRPPHKRVVLTLHGIRTRGKWQKDLGDQLSAAGFITETLDYGHFSVIGLVLPWSRRRKVEWLRKQYERIRARHKATPSVVAHSLGTYLLAQAMEKWPDDIVFDQIVLCGAIVRTDFPWSKAHDSGHFRRCLNDYGRADIWCSIAQWFIRDAGPSGRQGFHDSAGGALLQHERNFRHSDYFYDLNYQHRWIPFLHGDQLHPPKLLPSPTSTNWRYAAVLTIATILLGFGLKTSWDSMFPADGLDDQHSPAWLDLWRSASSDTSRRDDFGNKALTPHSNLAPLGRHKDTGLWEFAVLGTGEIPEWDGSTESGQAIAKPTNAIIVVLIPPPERDSGHFLAIAKTELTQHQWFKISGVAASKPKDRPAHSLSYSEALTNMASVGARLPTEEEWEYACKAGATDRTSHRSGFGWSRENTKQLQPVGSLPPNSWGLLDMHGNVGEWCFGEFDSGLPVTHPVRGGSIHESATSCTCAFRRGRPSNFRSNETGVRPVVDITTR